MSVREEAASAGRLTSGAALGHAAENLLIRLDIPMRVPLPSTREGKESMAGHGYSFVTDKGYNGFTRELSEGPWGAVSITKYDADEEVAKLPLADTPAVVVWKLRALWGIRGVAKATGVDALAELDAEWDSAQRALNLAVGVAEEHQDPATRAAAKRIRVSILDGGGIAQTQYGFDQEVDFALNQLDLAGRSPLADDVKTAGIGEHLQRVQVATEAFAIALGRGTGKGRAPARARRIREALIACSAAFNGVHDAIAWAIEHTLELEEKARLEALLAPLHALLERYPAPAAPAAPAAGQTPAEGGASGGSTPT